MNDFPSELKYRGETYKITKKMQMRLGVAIEEEFTALEILRAGELAGGDPLKFPAYKTASAFSAALTFFGVDHDPRQIVHDLNVEPENILNFLIDFAMASLPSNAPSKATNDEKESRPAKKRKASTKQPT